MFNFFSRDKESGTQEDYPPLLRKEPEALDPKKHTGAEHEQIGPIIAALEALPQGDSELETLLLVLKGAEERPVFTKELRDDINSKLEGYTKRYKLDSRLRLPE